MFLILRILFKDIATTHSPDFTTATPFHPQSGMLMLNTASQLHCRIFNEIFAKQLQIYSKYYSNRVHVCW